VIGKQTMKMQVSAYDGRHIDATHWDNGVVVAERDTAFAEVSVCAVLGEIHAEGGVEVGAGEVVAGGWESLVEEIPWWTLGQHRTCPCKRLYSLLRRHWGLSR